jgi:hypothetical protein
MSALGLDCGTGETKLLHFKQTPKGNVEIAELCKLDCLEHFCTGKPEAAEAVDKMKKVVREAIEKVGAIFKIFPNTPPPPRPFLSLIRDRSLINSSHKDQPSTPLLRVDGLVSRCLGHHSHCDGRICPHTSSGV